MRKWKGTFSEAWNLTFWVEFQETPIHDQKSLESSGGHFFLKPTSRLIYGNWLMCIELEEWRQKLKEMIWAFEYYRDSSEIWWQDKKRVGTEQAEKNKEINEKRAKEGLKIFVEHFRDLWD